MSGSGSSSVVSGCWMGSPITGATSAGLTPVRKFLCVMFKYNILLMYGQLRRYLSYVKNNNAQHVTSEC